MDLSRAMQSSRKRFPEQVSFESGFKSAPVSLKEMGPHLLADRLKKLPVDGVSWETRIVHDACSKSLEMRLEI